MFRKFYVYIYADGIAKIVPSANTQYNNIKKIVPMIS